MKRVISLFSLFSIILLGLLFFIFPKNYINAEEFSRDIQSKQGRFSIPPHTMPATIFKEYVIEQLANENSQAFECLKPLMLMATQQHELARNVLQFKTELTNEQELSLQHHPTTAELSLAIKIVASGQNVATACKKLLPYVKKIEVQEKEPIRNNNHQIIEITKKLNHLAFIPDGNRRWAKERGLSPSEGHRIGFTKTAPMLIQAAWDLGINTVTIWCSSPGNLSRNKQEVDLALGYFKTLTEIMIPIAQKYEAKIIHLGDKSHLPNYLVEKIKEAEEKTKHFNKQILNLGINYSSRDEICRAIKTITKEKLSDEITEETISKILDTGSQQYPDPDLIIRTSGEKRLSGFMVWQSLYSELYFTKQFFPDFDEHSLIKAIINFGERKRTFSK